MSGAAAEQAALAPWHQYAVDVLEGREPANKWVELACNRHLVDLEDSLSGARDDIYFDEAEAERFLRFCNLCKHWKGHLSGEPFEPLGWQAFIFGNLFGWKMSATGLRRFRKAHIEVARKNGKSFMGAAAALWMLIADKEKGAECYVVSTDYGNAKGAVFDVALNFARQSPALAKRCRILETKLEELKTRGKFIPKSARPKGLNSLNVHFGLLDELHEHPNRDCYDRMASGTSARRQPLIMSITTAGVDEDSICGEQYLYGQAVVDPKDDFVDDRFFCYLSGADEKDDWEDPKVWRKANPSTSALPGLLEDLETKANEAKRDTKKLPEFQRMHLNMWGIELGGSLFDMTEWDACDHGDQAEILGGLDCPFLERMRGERCFLSLDLSASLATTALVASFPGHDPLPIWGHIFIAGGGETATEVKNRLKNAERRDRSAYSSWIKQGLCTVSDLKIVDYEQVIAMVLALRERLNVRQLAYDPKYAPQTITTLEKHGIECVSIPQSAARLSGPTLEMRRLVRAGQLQHFGHPVFRKHASGASPRGSGDDMWFQAKNKNARIDMISALVLGVQRVQALQSEEAAGRYDRAAHARAARDRPTRPAQERW